MGTAVGVGSKLQLTTVSKECVQILRNSINNSISSTLILVYPACTGVGVWLNHPNICLDSLVQRSMHVNEPPNYHNPLGNHCLTVVAT